MLNGLDLFSGIGGISCSLRGYVRPLAYCENDRFCQSVLLSKMQRGDLSKGPIWDDVRTLNKAVLPKIDIMYGGFPCQDISIAGNGKGLAGERSGLVVEIFRLAYELRPSFIFLENVPAIRTRGLGRVVSTLSLIGYDCRWTIVSAAELGAPHLRKRWFLLAYSDGLGLREKQRKKLSKFKRQILADDDCEAQPLAPPSDTAAMFGVTKFGNEPNRDPKWIKKVANTDCERSQDGRSIELEKGFNQRTFTKPERCSGSWWETEPSVGRVADGIPHRVDRLRGLGNSVVPSQAREAFERLMGI